MVPIRINHKGTAMMHEVMWIRYCFNLLPLSVYASEKESLKASEKLPKTILSTTIRWQLFMWWKSTILVYQKISTIQQTNLLNLPRTSTQLYVMSILSCCLFILIFVAMKYVVVTSKTRHVHQRDPSTYPHNLHEYILLSFRKIVSWFYFSKVLDSPCSPFSNLATLTSVKPLLSAATLKSAFKEFLTVCAAMANALFKEIPACL